MPEPREIVYSHEDLLRLLLKDQGVKSGNWMLLIRFTHFGANIPLRDSADAWHPGSVTLIREIGIVQTDTVVPGITLDAATGKLPVGTTVADKVRRMQRTGKKLASKRRTAQR